MTLWIPAKHYRTGRAVDRVDLLVLHTAQGARSVEALGRYFATTTRPASAHSGVDDNERANYVRFGDTAFAAPGANADGEHLELCGMAEWTRAKWLTEHRRMLDHAAAWLAERCRARGIPPVLLTAPDLRANRRGITTHYAVSEAFHQSTHSDPGINFPLDVVLAGTRSRISALQAAALRSTPFPFPAGHYLGTPRPSKFCHSGVLGGADARAVLAWQRRMRQRGFDLTIDGIYGPRSRAACLQLQRHTSKLGGDGLVGAATWRYTFGPI